MGRLPPIHGTNPKLQKYTTIYKEYKLPRYDTDGTLQRIYGHHKLSRYLPDAILQKYVLDNSSF